MKTIPYNRTYLNYKNERMKKITFILLPLFLFILIACNGSDTKEKDTGEKEIESSSDCEEMKDSRDNQKYCIVDIGNQTWMAENLNYETNNSWCYDDNPDNCKTFGRLYNWNAAKNACPEGWHLASDEEWQTLEMELGMSAEEASQGGEFLAENRRFSGNVAAKLSDFVEGGDNSSGFSALLAGNRTPDGGYEFLNRETTFWTSTISKYPMTRTIVFFDAAVSRYQVDEEYGYSVRCLQD